MGLFCHLRQMCVKLFTLPHFVLSFPTKAFVSSVHFSPAMIIRPSVFCTLRVTLSRFNVIFLGFLRVINVVTITSLNNIIALIP
jgi:hypothetical protein